MMVLLHEVGPVEALQFLNPAWQSIQVFAVGELQDFSSRLYRDPEASGILHCTLPDVAPQLVRGMREGNVHNRLVVLLRESPVDQLRIAARRATLFAGADDVQPDSIDPRELVARLRAIGARGRYLDHLKIPLPGAVYDHERGVIEAEDGRTVRLGLYEARFLQTLARQPSVLFTRERMMDALYNGLDEPNTKVCDVWVMKVRRKVMAATGGIDVIRTVWGQGWMFDPEGYVPDRTMYRGGAST